MRGQLSAFDAKTGKLVWRTWMTPDPTQVPYILTWANPAEAAVGGAPIWNIPTYNIKDRLVYVGTGNAYPYLGRSPDDRERAVESWMGMLARPGQSNRVRLRHRRRDGSWLWLEITNHNLLDDPSHGYVRAELMDISDEMVAQEALRAREQLLHRLAEALPLGVFQVDRDGAVVYANERLAEGLRATGARP